MTDIVERLRNGVLISPIGYIQTVEANMTMEEAADEIERQRQALHDIYEVYAGSEGIPKPQTCAEAYLLERMMYMVEIAARHKK